MRGVMAERVGTTGITETTGMIGTAGMIGTTGTIGITGIIGTTLGVNEVLTEMLYKMSEKV